MTKKIEKSKKERLLVFSAHSDDWTLGAGGTIKKYADEGGKAHVIVFSYGEMSHPWLKPDVVRSMRVKEAKDAAKILDCSIEFYDIKEGKFLEQAQEKNVYDTIKRLIESYAPTKVLSHSNEDPHPDHRAVYSIISQVFDTLENPPELYIYSVWNPVSFKTKFPALYVDVSKTFSAKLKALKAFTSQKVHVAYPLFILIYRSIKDGFKIRKRFGEHYFRIR